MLNITNALNFKTFATNTRKTNNNFSSTPINAPKLKPLSKDTISFSGVVEYKAAINNQEVCKQLHEDAKEAKDYLENAVELGFNHLVRSEKNPNGIIAPIKGRVKSKESIEEKISNKIKKALESRDVKDNIFSPYNMDEIKEKIRDIAGTRIVINNAHDNHMGAIVESLCKTIVESGLIIDKVENLYPASPDIEKYFTSEQLDEIQKAINEVRDLNSLPPIEIMNTQSKTGYMALHLDVDLTSIGKFRKNRGFHGELQILGLDVAMLKDIEDFCYKLKQGMGIKSQHPAYAPFEKFFLEAHQNTAQYPHAQEKFEEYTRLAYQIQRKKMPKLNISDGNVEEYRYPTIEECGLKDELPPILDFNVLARIKKNCDDLFYAYNHPARIVRELTAKNNN